MSRLTGQGRLQRTDYGVSLAVREEHEKWPDEIGRVYLNKFSDHSLVSMSKKNEKLATHPGSFMVIDLFSRKLAERVLKQAQSGREVH